MIARGEALLEDVSLGPLRLVSRPVIHLAAPPQQGTDGLSGGGQVGLHIQGIPSSAELDLSPG